MPACGHLNFQSCKHKLSKWQAHISLLLERQSLPSDTHQAQEVYVVPSVVLSVQNVCARTDQPTPSWESATSCTVSVPLWLISAQHWSLKHSSIPATSTKTGQSQSRCWSLLFKENSCGIATSHILLKGLDVYHIQNLSWLQLVLILLLRLAGAKWRFDCTICVSHGCLPTLTKEK